MAESEQRARAEAYFTDHSGILSFKDGSIHRVGLSDAISYAASERARVERETREADCKAMCKVCAGEYVTYEAGVEVFRGYLVHWKKGADRKHGRLDYTLCDAAAIHDLIPMEGEKTDDFDLPGCEFYSGGKQMKYIYPEVSHSFAGWIVYKHPEGQWVSLRKATESDLRVLFPEPVVPTQLKAAPKDSQ